MSKQLKEYTREEVAQVRLFSLVKSYKPTDVWRCVHSTIPRMI